jgi:hypothetical protein
MTDSMVTRVAKAIRRANLKTVGFVPTDRYSLEDEIANSWDLFTPEARAALEAMRKPTTAMVKAASPVSIIGRWDAMINAALQEGER